MRAFSCPHLLRGTSSSFFSGASIHSARPKPLGGLARQRRRRWEPLLGAALPACDRHPSPKMAENVPQEIADAIKEAVENVGAGRRAWSASCRGHAAAAVVSLLRLFSPIPCPLLYRDVPCRLVLDACLRTLLRVYVPARSLILCRWRMPPRTTRRSGRTLPRAAS